MGICRHLSLLHNTWTSSSGNLKRGKLTLQKLKQGLLWFGDYAKCQFHCPILVNVGMCNQFSIQPQVVSTVVIMNISVFWNMTLHSLVDVYQYFWNMTLHTLVDVNQYFWNMTLHSLVDVNQYFKGTWLL
jgi:hypothetical protein